MKKGVGMKKRIVFLAVMKNGKEDLMNY